jgi:acetyl/propionyl-CoA carboxylase alpha subunit
MGRAAVEAAQAAEYENAGTVEFIVDPMTRQFYFLEMNTRLQVEHPITELTTGLDLVQWQVRIACGEELPYTQGELQQRGHAIECRVYAEDPSNQYLPSTGVLLRVVEPKGPGIRVDSGVESDDSVSIHYDPMLAKVIAHAETRDRAIRRMRTALMDYAVLGVTTNMGLLQRILAHPEFVHGRATTAFMDQYSHELLPDVGAQLPQALTAAALSELHATHLGARGPESTGESTDPWARTDSFRIGM